MKNSEKSTGAVYMLIGLVCLLMAPIAIDHIMHSANAATSQADAK